VGVLFSFGHWVMGSQKKPRDEREQSSMDLPFPITRFLCLKPNIPISAKENQILSNPTPLFSRSFSLPPLPRSNPNITVTKPFSPRCLVPKLSPYIFFYSNLITLMQRFVLGYSEHNNDPDSVSCYRASNPSNLQKKNTTSSFGCRTVRIT